MNQLSSFNSQDLLLMAKLSRDVYSGNVFFRDRFTDAKGSFTEIDNKFILFFRGTTSWRNWLYNLQSFINYASMDVEIHPGYLSIYERFSSRILAVVEGSLHYDQPLYLTGHSAGAAIATTAAYFLSSYWSNIYLVTFGSPRVGNSEFVNRINNTVHHYRVCNLLDVVTYTPTLMQGYKHSGETIKSGSVGHSMDRYYTSINGKVLNNEEIL